MTPHPAGFVDRWQVPALVFGAWLFLFGAPSLEAASATKIRFDIPADRAERALKQLSEQSGVAVLFPTEAVSDVRTRAVRGEMTAREALDAMLAGTVLESVEYTETGALTVRRKPAKEEPKRRESGPPVEGGGGASGWAGVAEEGNFGAIEGRVLNSVTGRFLSNARLAVRGTGVLVLSDEFGHYRLGRIPSGRAILEVFYTGLEPQIIAVDVRAGEVVPQDIELASRSRGGSGEGGALALDPFLVATERERNAQEMATNERRFAANVKNVVSADQFGDVSDGNVGEFLKYLPGVTVGYSSWDPNTVSLRGFPSSTTVLSVDGADVASVSSGNDRTVTLFGLSMNNLSRVEVSKSPTPDLPANALGGAVNLISVNAFERRTPQVTYRAYTNFNAKNATFGKVPGPDKHLTLMGIQPGLDFRAIVPVSDTFGYTVTGLYSRRYGRTDASQPNWVGVSTAGAGATAQNPYLGSYGQTQAAALWTRSVASASFDWKFRPHDVLSFSLQYSLADTYHSTPAFTANPGAPESFGATFVQGRQAAQPWSSYLWTRQIYMKAFLGKLAYRHTGPIWEFTTGASYSTGSYSNEPPAPEAIGRAMFRLRNAAVRYDDIEDGVPGKITARTAAGVELNAFDQNNLTLESVQNQWTNASDLNWSVQGDARRDLDLIFPVRLKVGTQVKVRKKDRRTVTDLWQFVGPDGVINTADDLAARYDLMSTSNYRELPFGMPSAARWVDLAKVTSLFQASPQYFRLNEVNRISTAATSSLITETISSAYIRADVRLLDNRLWLIGGVRYEHTEDDAYGLLNDLRATYQQDADGNLIIGSNGRPVPVTTDPVATARLRYRDRGAHAKRDYGDFYPSLNAVLSLRENLLVRGAFAQTIGRPNFGVITPGTTISDPASTAVKTITVNNTALKPWSADSFDLSIEYYPRNGTVLSLGAFHKNIADFFGGRSLPATLALLEEYGLNEEYLDYVVNTQENVGNARISGIEAEVRFIVPFMPSWLQGLQIYGNGTSQSLRGASLADFSEYMARSANGGFRLSRPRYSVMLNWNYQGRIRGLALTGSVEPDSYRYTSPKTFVDLNLEYRLGRHVSLYAVVKNLSDTVTRLQRYGPNAAPYARTFSAQRYGRQITLGLKGRF